MSPGAQSSSSSVRRQSWTGVRRSDFTTVGFLGDGGFGSVRLVVYEVDGKRYALKSIQHADIKEMVLSGHTESLVSPISERDIGIAARKWHSPFIVKLYATFQTVEKLHYVYELCPGGDLYDLQDQQEGGFFRELDAQFYIAEISLGLSHLHCHNVVHGDVKLENVLIAKDSHVKLTDLGSASMALPTSGLAVPAASSPKVQATYSPPEVRNGGGFGKELDCWQLGYAAVAMLSGRYLALDQEEVQLPLQEMLSGNGVSENAHALCQALLASDRRDRLGFPDGASSLQTHIFFEALNWAAFEEKLVDPPIVFETFPVYGRGRLESDSPTLSPKSSRRIRGFTWCDGPELDDL